MKIEVLDKEFSVCKLKDFSKVDYDGEIFFLAKTDEECSLVCCTGHEPENTTGREDGWRAFRIAETLDFSLVGILSKLTALLAERGIGIFAVSTYNTDYILVKKENLEKAVDALEESGYQIVR